MQNLNLRVVTDRAETEKINAFISAVATASCADAYSPKQIQLLNKHVFGIHSSEDGDWAVEDGTFYVLENEDGDLIATCAWTKRGFKGEILDPEQSPARIRTCFVDPKYQQFGIASFLLMVCENAALEAQFKNAELFATLNGRDFYQKKAYIENERRGYGITAPPLEGETLEFRLMRKNVLVENDLSIILARLAEKSLTITFAEDMKTVADFTHPIIHSAAGTALSARGTQFFAPTQTGEAAINSSTLMPPL